MTDTPTPLKDAILRGADALDAMSPFKHNRKKYANASEIWGCVRKQWFDKHLPDSEKAPESWGFARRGQTIEGWVDKCLRAANLPLGGTGADQVSLIDDERKIAGTPDGYISLDGKLYVVEIKSIDPRKKLDSLPMKGHIAQLETNIALYNHLYGGAVGGKLIYVNASDFDTILEYDVAAPPANHLDSLAGRVSKILKTKKVEVLDREGQMRDFARECRFCPFTKQCGVVIDDSDSPTTGRRGTKLHGLVVAMHDLKQKQDVAKQEYDALRADIIKAMESENITFKEYPTEGLRVSITQTKGRSSFDRKTAERVVGDLSAYYKTGSGSVTLKVEKLS